MIQLNDIPILALFDTRASHSFISQRACENLALVPGQIENPLQISVPSGMAMITKRACMGQSLKIGGQEFWVDLFVIIMMEFDIILRMD